MSLLAPFVVVDVQYDGSRGSAAAVVGADFRTAEVLEERVAAVPDVAPYRPGAFYERELPCILAVLAQVSAKVRAVIVDGYVDLDDAGRPGLGAHLHHKLRSGVVVIGVAKTRFAGATSAREVIRGASRSPLFVTARGLAVEEAAELVRTMHGPYRIPTLLGRADRLARGRDG